MFVVFSVNRKKTLKEDTMQAKRTKIGRNKIENVASDEDCIKIKRIKQIMEEEKTVADIKKVHEERMATMKENFYKELHALEIRAAIAKAELAEL